MSKLKVNDKVIIKENGKIGVIKGREVYPLDNNRIKVEYVVKTDNGFENWNSYARNELKKVQTAHEQKVPQTLVVDAPNGYKVTLVALKETIKEFDFIEDEKGVYNPYVRNRKKLCIGYSIYNPNDVYDPNLGIRIAINRAKKAPFSNLVSAFCGEFTTETINALLKVKGDYIVNHLSKFIG